MKELLMPQQNKTKEIIGKTKSSEKISITDVREAGQELFDYYENGQLSLEKLLETWKNSPALDSFFYMGILNHLEQKDKKNLKKYGKGRKNEKLEKDIKIFLYNFSGNTDELLLPNDCYIKVFIIKKITEIGTPYDLGYFLNHLPTDSISPLLYRKELAEMFKIVSEKYKSDYAAEKAFDFIAWGKPKYSEEEKNLLLTIITDILGAEESRNRFNNLIEEYQQEKMPDAVDRLEYAHSFITPNHDKTAITNLQKFYSEKIKFEDYKINERMNAREVELLQSLIGKDEKVLEEGCGTGRLFLEMKKAGYDMTGFDFTKRHVDLVKQKDPSAKVSQDDWHKTKYEDAGFDTVYSLGRNLLHDYSIVDQAATFREAARILKPGGKFIFDIPNREKGGYKELVEGYAKEMKARGIRNFRYGTIYDSPDGENFATRYAYSPEDIEQLASLAGFRIVKVEKRKLETGKEDENLYYVLEKIN